MSPDAIDALVRMGCTAQQVAEAVKADMLAHEAKQEEKRAQRREGNRRRQAAWREREQAKRNADNEHNAVMSRDGVPPKERFHTSKETTPSQSSEPVGSSEKAPSAKSTPRSELERVLDAQHAADVVEHRKRIGAPLTASAAAKLANNLARYDGDPNEAADEMLANGWRGFKPEWTQSRRGTNERAYSRPIDNGDRFEAAFDNIEARQHFRGSGTPHEDEREHVGGVQGRTVTLERRVDGGYGDGGQYPRLVGSGGRL